MAVVQKKERYTYGDYLNWPEEERWELIDGVPYAMSPAPPRRHQEILGELYRQFANYLLDKACKVYLAPFDVRLPEGNEKDTEVKTVVQPDLVVVCDQSRLDERGCKGSPDLVIEVVSPTTLKRDLREKFYLYEKAGIKEYWVVNPVEKNVLVFVLGEDKKYGRHEIYFEDEQVRVKVLAGLTIDLREVFKE
ncbi:MAG: Uma2 family endonuclease [Armatimonadetes bacterium]|nr:Uma2 family endonuclease [Armatimonadota bacterium]